MGRKVHESLTFDRVEEAVQADESLGFCLACGADAEGVEPDARRYRCEECGEHYVCGAEEVLILGAFYSKPEAVKTEGGAS